MVRYGTVAQLDMEWIEDWARKVNEDRVLRVIGRFFTANFVLGIEDKDYLHRPEEVVIYPGAGRALNRLLQADFKLIMVTNQSGVGRGRFPIEDVHRVHEHLLRELAREGVRFDKIYIAPEAPDVPSRGRKPSPGGSSRTSSSSSRSR